jgi:sigma-B regulation protein RsbU (phosphoserine phosphatase)
MKERVLVVDDDAAIRHTLERVLSPMYEVVTAVGPTDALVAVGQKPFNVALVDVHLQSSGDGYTLCHQIRELTPETDVILITGSVSQPDQKLYRSLEEGAFYFLFKPFERKVLRALVGRCVDLQRERRAKEAFARELAEDLERARAFQRSLLPRGGLDASGWRLAGRYLSCDALGGDFYFWLVERDGSVVFALADVVGHGVSAALYAGMLRSTLVSARRIDPDPERAVREILRGADFFDGSRYATFFYARLFPDGRMRYVNAGHPAVLHVTPDGRVERLKATGLFLTRSFPGLPRPAHEVRLEPGARLIASTDGLEEAFNPREEEFGAARLERAALECREKTPAEMVRHLLERLDRHCEGRPLADDVTVVSVARA